MSDGEMQVIFSLTGEGLVLTVPQSRVFMCEECEDYHALVLGAEGGNLKQRILHMAEGIRELTEHGG